MRNEKGSALLLSLGLLIIFIILGVSLFTMTSSGITKSDTRESKVQAQDLSNKSLDYVKERLTFELQQELNVDANGDGKADGLSAEDFKASFVMKLNANMCENPKVNDPEVRDSILGDKLTQKIEELKSSPSAVYQTLSNTTTGDASYCIVSYKNTYSNGVENEFTKDITFLTKGLTNGHDSHLVSTVSIGSNSIPDVLNYALGTSVPSNAKAGDGNIILIGESEIEGNVYAAGQLITSQSRYYDMVKTDFPIFYNKDKNGNKIPVKVVLGKKAYTLTSNKDTDYKYNECAADYLDTSINFTNKCGTNSKNLKFNHISDVTSDYTKIFSKKSKVSFVTATPNREPIDIDGAIDVARKNTVGNASIGLVQGNPTVLKFNQSVYGDLINKTAKTINNSGFNKTANVAVRPTYTTQENGSCKKWSTNKRGQKECQEYEKISIHNKYIDTRLLAGDYSVNSVYIDTSVSITGRKSESDPRNTKNTGKTTLAAYKDNQGKGGIIYINGDLCIGSDHIHSLDTKFGDSTCSNDLMATSKGGTSAIDVELEGAIYVNGVVVVSDANIKANALIYATKGFELKDTTINGKTLENGKTGNLLLFTKGEQHFSGTSGKLNGFYYSESAFVGWGNKNGLMIDGGVSGRKIYLYTTAGSYPLDIKTKDGNQYIEAPLKIKYNPEIVETYSDLKHEEPKIYKIDTVELKDLLVQ